MLRMSEVGSRLARECSMKNYPLPLRQLSHSREELVYLVLLVPRGCQPFSEPAHFAGQLAAATLRESL